MSIAEELNNKIEKFHEIYADFEAVNDSFKDLEELDETQKEVYSKAFSTLRTAVLEIEELRRKQDEEIMLNKAQFIVHDLALHLDTDSQGQVSFSTLAASTEEISKLMDLSKPSFKQIAELRLVGIGTGSAVLFVDACAKETQDSEIARQSVKDMTEIISKAQNMAADQQKSTKQKVNEFAKNNSLSTERAIEIVRHVEEISKKKNKIIALNAASPNKASAPVSLGNEFDRKRFETFSSNVKNEFKEEEPLVIEGQMRMTENWDNTHKFKVHDYEKNKDYIINFDPKSFSKESISNHLGETVKIERMKVGKSWILLKFL